MLELSQETQRALLIAKGSGAYDAVRDILEKLCIIAETRHFQMDRKRGDLPDAILASHGECRAKRELFEQLQMEIEIQTRDLMEAQKAAEPEEQEDGVPVGS